MPIYEYRLAQQVDHAGFFGEIRIESRPLDEDKIDVELDPMHACWTDSIRFATRYFLQHARGPKGLHVKVLEQKTNDVDTTHMIMAFMTIKALQRAYGIGEEAWTTFDAEHKVFLFLR